MRIEDKVIKIINILKLVGANKKGKIERFSNCEILIKNGMIHEIGNGLNPGQRSITIDAKRCLVTPGFVDPHTHIFPPNDRANEFSLRPIKTYEQIAKAGGGILSSVRAIRESSEEKILKVNELSVERFFRQGTTTLEMKSGYGLNTENELKLLRIIKLLQSHFSGRVEIVPTFLGAHAFPEEYKDKKDQYVDLIVKEMIPEVAKQKLAEYVDVFCEIGYFDVKQSERILQAALDHSLKIRLHADEFKDSGASELAGRLKAHSADHLMAISDKGIDALAENKIIATMLPGTTVFLGKQGFAPVRKMIEKGIKVAIATDFNPGSSVFQSQPLMMNFAMNYGKMSLEEAFLGCTKHAAQSLRRNTGIIEIGAQADLVFWNQLTDINQIPYYNVESRHFIRGVMKKGNYMNFI